MSAAILFRFEPNALVALGHGPTGNCLMKPFQPRLPPPGLTRPPGQGWLTFLPNLLQILPSWTSFVPTIDFDPLWLPTRN